MSESNGVMTGEYAEQRARKLHLKYRYQVRARVAVEALREIHPGISDPSVLELGAAEGVTLLEMRRLLGDGGRYLGIELSDSLLASAPALPAGVQLVKGDVMAVPPDAEPDSFDLCTALAVLEHLPDPLACAREAMRLLKPGGVFVATCPNPFWDELADKVGFGANDHHETEVDLAYLSTLARDAGFEQVRAYPFMWVGTGALPYLGLSVGAARSLRIDARLRRLRVFDPFFVNQVVVGVKPR